MSTRESELQRLNDDMQKQKEVVESRLEEIQARRAQLTPGIDSLDRAVIASVDTICQQALDTLLSFL